MQTQSSPSLRAGGVTLLVGTRKGAFIYRADASRRNWQVDGPHFLGSIVNHLVFGTGDSLAQLMAFLDTRYPGMRHRMIDEQNRIRPHIRLFVNGEGASSLERRLAAGDEVIIVAALSGG
jgi:molybdopterin converting factor small subunit